MRGQHLHHRSESLAPELAGYGVSAVDVRVHDSQQTHRLALLFEFFVDPGVITSKNTHTDHGDGNRILRGQEDFSMAGCRKENCNRKSGKQHLD
jgi:hypothetical protein